MAEYVKFSVGKELKEKQFELIEKVTKTGKIRIGVNETTKAIERGKAKIIFIAEDVSPQELVMHLPLLCEEKKIPYSFISTKKELGEKAGIAVGTASIALIEEGSAKKELEEVIKKVSELKKV
ncbi:MAG: 50S ribosomal protein L7ae [Candidatus Diapherotrites archaeon CG10_big_fil_rev_8_21_14_0_10_31_34]|nr:MAG: 50S ribosomal protein L7ae [Candidatus Diapherotrites archaeon CG10_big_fil_rev_8_21_14_0_10_31_34]